MSGSAWVYLIDTGDITVAELRRLNRETLHGWPVGLLLALRDANVSTDPSSISLTAGIHRGLTLVCDVIRVKQPDGKVVAIIAECDDGNFVVMRTIKGTVS